MIFRTDSYLLVDAIINHPDVRPTMEKGSHRLSSEDVVTNPDNVVYTCETGVILFVREAPGVYKGHIGMLTDGRGKIALEAGRAALDDLYEQHDVKIVHAAVPLQLRGARMLCRLLGFRPAGVDTEQEFFVH